MASYVYIKTHSAVLPPSQVAGRLNYVESFNWTCRWSRKLIRVLDHPASLKYAPNLALSNSIAVLDCTVQRVTHSNLVKVFYNPEIIFWAVVLHDLISIFHRQFLPWWALHDGKCMSSTSEPESTTNNTFNTNSISTSFSEPQQY